MLIVPIKRTESTKIFKNLEKYIKKNYDKASLERVRPYLTEGDGIRDSLIATVNVAYDGLGQAIQNTAKYFRYVKSLERFIPIQSTDLKFTWFDTLSKRKFPVLTYKLEKICVLYNLAALHSRQGAEINLAGTDAHKIALNAFQVSMGCLNEIRKMGVEAKLENNVDLTSENLSMLISILTAQCYFIMYDRLDKATANKQNLAKLAFTIHKNYEQSHGIATSARLTKDYQEEFKNSLKFQSQAYAAVAHYWMSFGEREEGMKLGTGFGKGVSRLRFAYNFIQKAMQIKGLRGNILEFGRTQLTNIRREKETAESENLSIYMDGIPETVGPIDELTMVQPKFPPQVDIDSIVSGQEVLLCLVPKEVLALCAEYKEVLHQMVSAESRKITDNKRDKDQVLESMGLPQKITALSSESGLPDSIWKKIQQCQVSGGYAQLENSLTSLRQLSEGCVKTLTDFQSTLQREEDEDKTLRQSYGYQWGRATSAAINTGFKADIDKYSQKLQMAMQLDRNSFNTWQTNQEILALLKKGKPELDALIPANDVEANPNEAAEALKAALDGLAGKELVVGETLKTLEIEADQDNIIEELLRLVEQRLPKEATFAAQVAKFSGRREEVNSKIAEFRQELETVGRLNADFERVRGSIRSNPQRVQILTQLEQSVKVYTDLASIFSQGHQFYGNLSTHLSVLQQRIADFVYSRNIEKNELMAQICGKGPQGGVNPYGQFYPQGHPQGNPYGQFK